MKMTRDFCSGYLSAVVDLGREGDHRCVDWSAAYNYLKELLNTFEPIGEGLVDQLRYRGGICVDAADEIKRLRTALIEIEHHSTDKNAAATARAALAIADEQSAIDGEKS